jgi:hypothetical protein
MRRAAALLTAASMAAACHDSIATTHPAANDSPHPRTLANATRDARDAPLLEAAYGSGSSAGTASTNARCDSTRRRLGDGLTAEQRPLDATPAAGVEPCFDVVRADADRYRLTMLTKAHDGGSSQPGPAWRERFRLVAVTNAGMFHASGKPVGLVIDDGTALSKDHPQFGGYLAFDPTTSGDAPIVIAGRDCPGFELADLRRRYRSILQTNRLLGCTGEALPWKDPKQYSAAVVALDRDGNPVFIHARAAVTMSELARAVAALDLAGAMFLEGGPEATLVVRGSEGELSRVGSYETGFVENDENRSYYWLPNVLALEAAP